MSMFDRPIPELYANPCPSCWACDFKKDPKCYQGSYKQCSVCAVIQRVIDACDVLPKKGTSK